MEPQAVEKTEGGGRIQTSPAPSSVGERGELHLWGEAMPTFCFCTFKTRKQRRGTEENVHMGLPRDKLPGFSAPTSK